MCIFIYNQIGVSEKFYSRIIRGLIITLCRRRIGKFGNKNLFRKTFRDFVRVTGRNVETWHL